MRSKQLFGGLLACLTFLTLNSFGTIINANAVCQMGCSASADVLQPGDSIVIPFQFLYTFPNTDQYQAYGQVSASNAADGSYAVSPSMNVIYLGNGLNTTSSTDSLVVNFSQNFATALAKATNTRGYEAVFGSFSGGLAPTSNLSVQGLSGDGTAMDAMSFSAGDLSPSFMAARVSQPLTVGPTTQLAFQATATFGSGSTVGSAITIGDPTVPVNASAVPEPAAWALSSSGLLLVLLGWRRRARN